MASAARALLAVLVVAGLVPSSRQCEADTSCLCDNDYGFDYVLHCPSLVNKVIDVQVKRRIKANILCNNNESPSDVFSAIKRLQVGNVSRVKLQDCPVPPEPLQEVLAAMGVTHLRSLEIVGGQVDVSMLHNSTVTTLKLKHLQQLHIGESGFPAGLKLIELNTIGNMTFSDNPFRHLSQLQVLGINYSPGFPLAADMLEDLASLRDLRISNSRLVTLPRGVFRNLKNLTTLVLYNNDLEALPANIFQNNTKLESVNLGGNSYLATLPANIFQHNTQLTSVNLAGNQPTSLPENLFLNQQNMTKFEFITASFYDDDRRLRLPSTMFPSAITVINIIRVTIESLPETLLQNCENLTEFRIQSGQISDIPVDFFRSTRRIQLIDFANNSLTSLRPGTFSGLAQLASLRLHHNQLKQLQPEAAPGPQLQLLNLAHNLLTEAPSLEAGERRLQRLDLSHNLIGSVDLARLVRGSASLELDISSNLLAGHLDLSPLANLDMTRLEVKADHNQLRGLRLHGATDTRAPVLVSVAHNPLECDCFAEVARRAQNLALLHYSCGEAGSLEAAAPRQLLCPAAEVARPCAAGCSCGVNTHRRHVAVTCVLGGARGGVSLARLGLLLDQYPGWTVDLGLDTGPATQLQLQLAHPGLTRLNLSHNQLEELQLDTVPPQLQLLLLDHNQLRHLAPRTLRMLGDRVNQTGLDIRLASNPFQCSCANTELLLFSQTHYNHLDKVTFSCGPGGVRWSRDEVTRRGLEVADICAEAASLYILAASLGLLLVLGLGLLVLAACYRDLILVFVFSQRWGRCLVSEEQLDR